MNLTIPIVNAIGLLLIAAGVAWWLRRDGKLTEKSVAFIVTGYAAFFVATIFYDYFLRTGSSLTIAVGLGMVLAICVLGYPYSRWVYRKFNSPR